MVCVMNYNLKVLVKLLILEQQMAEKCYDQALESTCVLRLALVAVHVAVAQLRCTIIGNASSWHTNN